MKASIIAARAKVETPDADPVDQEKSETTEPKAETQSPPSFSIEMTADEYFQYRTNKEAAAAKQLDLKLKLKRLTFHYS